MSYLYPEVWGEERRGSDHGSPSPHMHVCFAWDGNPALRCPFFSRRQRTGNSHKEFPVYPHLLLWRKEYSQLGKGSDRHTCPTDRQTDRHNLPHRQTCLPHRQTYLPHMYGPYNRSAALNHCSTAPDSLLVAVGRRQGSAHTRLLSQGREGGLRPKSPDLTYPVDLPLPCLALLPGWGSFPQQVGELLKEPKVNSDPSVNEMKELGRTGGYSWLWGSPRSADRPLGRALDDGSVSFMSEDGGWRGTVGIDFWALPKAQVTRTV